MSDSPSVQRKRPSMEDFLLRYDLADILAEAQQDYSQAKTAGPRLLEQKEISARFQRPRARVAPPGHEQR